MVRHEQLAAAFSHLGLLPLLLACASFAAAALLSARRWQLLLRYQGIEECLARLTEVYAIGLFCSLFLPTAAGGDAFRIFDVARRHKAAARVLLATAAGTPGWSASARHACGSFSLLSGSGTYCRRISACGRPRCLLLWRSSRSDGVAIWPDCRWPQRLFKGRAMPGTVARWLASPLAVRIAAFVAPLSSARQLPPRRTLRVVCLALATFAMSVLMGAVVCDALDVACSPLAACALSSPWSASSAWCRSHSNGIGIGEGAFVFLMSLFGVPAEKAAPVALALLGVQTAMSLGGGLLFMRRAMFGLGTPTTVVEAPAPVLLPFPRSEQHSGGAKRHAA